MYVFLASLVVLALVVLLVVLVFTVALIDAYRDVDGLMEREPAPQAGRPWLRGRQGRRAVRREPWPPASSSPPPPPSLAIRPEDVADG